LSLLVTDRPPSEPSPLALHDALPISEPRPRPRRDPRGERLRGDDPQEREADPSPAEGRGEEVAMPTVPVLDATGKQAGTMELKGDRKSTRLNSSHVSISYAVFCLKKK